VEDDCPEKRLQFLGAVFEKPGSGLCS
jgi:hypothetical protein